MNFNSEKIVLGGLLKDRGNVERISRIIGPEYFEKSEHRTLFQSILDYNESFDPVNNDDWADVVLFTKYLARTGKYHAVGGHDYLCDGLLSATVSGADAATHAEIVKSDYFKRKLRAVCTETAQNAANGADLAELLVRTRDNMDIIQAEAEVSLHAAGLRFTSMDSVEGKAIQWLWPNRIPANMLSILSGNPGIGKSFLTMSMIAALTTGRDWPDAVNAMDPGSVLLFANEDSLEYAIKPRLDAHGADCSKVFAFDMMDLKSGCDSFTIESDLKHLEKYLDSVLDCRLIVFDPITAYLGNVNANSNSDVRRVLLGLQELAQRRNVTVLGISHFSKKADLDAIHRTLGSTAFTAAARAVWAVVWDNTEEDGNTPHRRLLMPVKSNYSIDPSGLGFEIVEGQVCFDDTPVRSDVDRVMQKKKDPAAPSKKDRAKAIILEALQSGPVESDELIRIVTDEGISQRTADEARRGLRKAGKVDCDNPKGEGFIWFTV